MSELLKSCPFCGGEARYVEGYFSCDGRADRPFIALCTNCDARIELMPKWSEFNPYQMDGCEEEMRKLVFEEWNTRTHGTLTAEQVEKAIHDCSTYASYDGCTYYASGIRLQAIADELNGLGSWTCSIVKTWSDSDYVDGWRYRCSECGGFIPVDERDPETGDVISAANFCPNCGRKVVSA